jgi:phosphatidylinositol-3-phosphatase
VISSLRQIRLTRAQLAIVACLSAGVTAFVIATALGRTDAQSAALAALHGGPVTVAGGGASGSGSAGGGGAGSSQPVIESSGSGGGGGGASSNSSGGTAASTPSTGGGGGGVGGGGAGGGGAGSGTTKPKGSGAGKHKIGHVFVIALSTTSYDAAFGSASKARYLNGTLKPKGTLLGGYQTLSGAELPDYLGLVSGQPPNPATNAECQTYAEFPTGTTPSKSGLVTGSGCIYPNTIITVADQTTAAGHTWKAYIDDMSPSTCVHPNSGATDNTALPGAGPQYATRHNPFIYFHSLLDLGGCSSSDVSLTRLPADLRSKTKTPTFSFIAPGACDDASAQTCPDGKPAGIAGEDAFLKQWVPRITSSSAYKKNGMLVIAFALAGAPASAGPTPTGALVLSPFAARGKTISTVFDPYSVLRAVEDELGYTSLGHATSARSFAAKVLTHK